MFAYLSTYSTSYDYRNLLSSPYLEKLLLSKDPIEDHRLTVATPIPEYLLHKL